MIFLPYVLFFFLIEIKFTQHKINHFNHLEYNSVVFFLVYSQYCATTTTVYSRPFSSSQKEALCPVNSHSLVPPHPSDHCLLSVSMALSILDVSDKCRQIMCDLLYLAAFTLHTRVFLRVEISRYVG